MSVRIPFGEWLPDLPPTGLQGAITVTNVLPDKESYRPFPTLVNYSSGTNPGGRIQGAIFATDPATNNYNYAGDASALYVLTQQSYSNVTRLAGGAYTTATDDYWEFVNWGNNIIAVNGFVDKPQTISLGGANFSDMAIGVKGKHITVMRDFVVMGNVSDSATNIYRVRWSPINAPFNSWSADPTTLADYQDLPSDGGPVQKVLGGEYGVVLQQRSLWRMLFVGSPLIFQFDRIHNAIGAYVPQAAVRYQNLTFFLSEEGFYSFDGSNLNPIGRGKVDKFFFSDLQTTYFLRTNVTLDQANKLVIWAYANGSSSGGNPNRLLVYSWAYDRWALVDGLNIEYFTQSITTGYTLDGLDAVSTSIDALPFSLDSLQWTGGQVVLSAFNASHQLAKFQGSAMAAIVDTGEFQLFADRRAQLTEVRPLCDGLSASVSIAVINRNNLTESASIGYAATVPNTTGFVPVRVGARYFRIRMQVSANSNFLHLEGVEVEGTAEGRR